MTKPHNVCMQSAYLHNLVRAQAEGLCLQTGFVIIWLIWIEVGISFIALDKRDSQIIYLISPLKHLLWYSDWKHLLEALVMTTSIYGWFFFFFFFWFLFFEKYEKYQHFFVKNLTYSSAGLFCSCWQDTCTGVQVFRIIPDFRISRFLVPI